MPNNPSSPNTAGLGELPVALRHLHTNDSAVRLPPVLQTELEWALAEADREPGISASELFAELRQYE
jgi:hypothetical protein